MGLDFCESPMLSFSHGTTGRQYVNLTEKFLCTELALEEASRLLVYQAARYLDENKQSLIPKFCAMAKFFASDNAMKVTTDAIQVTGGYGYMKEAPLERMMRDAKLIQIYTGTNQIMRVVASREILK